MSTRVYLVSKVRILPVRVPGRTDLRQTLIFGSAGWAGLFGAPWALAPILTDAAGNNVGAVSVWSASGNTGIYNTGAGGSDCGGWTSATTASSAWYGFANTTSEWLDRGTLTTCDQLFHIYCFQVNHATPLDVAAFAETGRRIFVSNGNFSVTSGLAGADALCAADAQSTPALAGATFLAFLAGNGTSAAQRFTPSATPIVRIDGLRVANSFSALTSQDLIHPPSLRPNGTFYDWRVFVGAGGPSAVGTATTSCGGWTNANGNASEGFAYSVSFPNGDRQWFGNTDGSCSNHNNAIPVYCLEVEN